MNTAQAVAATKQEGSGFRVQEGRGMTILLKLRGMYG